MNVRSFFFFGLLLIKILFIYYNKVQYLKYFNCLLDSMSLGRYHRHRIQKMKINELKKRKTDVEYKVQPWLYNFHYCELRSFFFGSLFSILGKFGIKLGHALISSSGKLETKRTKFWTRSSCPLLKI